MDIPSHALPGLSQNFHCACP